MPHKLCKGRLVRQYERVKHLSNFKSHGRRWRPCGRIFKFCKFWRKEKEIEPFEVISENRQPNGFFWSNKTEKIVIPLLSADSRYFRIYALNDRKTEHFKITILQLPITLKQLATTSNGIILTFWLPARLTTTVKLRRPCLFKSYSQHWMPMSAVKSFYSIKEAFSLSLYRPFPFETS